MIYIFDTTFCVDLMDVIGKLGSAKLLSYGKFLLNYSYHYSPPKPYDNPGQMASFVNRLKYPGWKKLELLRSTGRTLCLSTERVRSAAGIS